MRRPAAVLLLVAAALAPAAPARAAEGCTVPRQNAFVRGLMHYIYLWYDQVPELDPAAAASPQAYIDAVCYRPLDRNFTFVTQLAAERALFTRSESVGLGIAIRLRAADDLRVLEAYPGTPAADAGLDRGHRILSVQGRPVAELVAAGQLGAALGPDEPGFVVRMRVRDLAGAERDLTMTKRTITIPTVSHARVIDSGGRRVGYVVVRNFVNPTTPALDEAFRELVAAGANELVVDVRYNGGGLISASQHLGSLVGGSRVTGQVFTDFTHNDRNSHRDFEIDFPQVQGALGVSRVVFLTTRSSASASELVINGLRPFLPVVVVGDSTFGKPVGQYTFAFCDKVAFITSFSLRNASGQGDFFSGIAPDCAAPDDLTHGLGDPAEAMLGAGLDYLRTGSCDAGAAARAAEARALAPAEDLQPAATDGWRQVLGVY